MVPVHPSADNNYGYALLRRSRSDKSGFEPFWDIDVSTFLNLQLQISCLDAETCRQPFDIETIEKRAKLSEHKFNLCGSLNESGIFSQGKFDDRVEWALVSYDPEAYDVFKKITLLVGKYPLKVLPKKDVTRP